MPEEEDLTNGAGAVYRKIIRPGRENVSPPPSGAEVTVHYEGWLLDGQKFDSSRDREQPFTFKLGVGQVIEGWDVAVAKMTPGEVSIFTCRSDYAYGWEGKPPKIPIDATLRFEIELISWKAGDKPIHEMSSEEMLVHGQSQREEGTTLLKAGKYTDAVGAFESAIESLATLRVLMLSGSPDPKRVTAVTDALISCNLNASQCHLKSEAWEAAVSCCSSVLALDTQNIKALYRRGLARAALEQYETAKDDLKAACMLDPKSREARDAYAKTKAAHDAHRKAERQAFGGRLDMFG